MTMSVDTVARSRRAVLIGAIGAVAASVGAALGRPAPVRAGVDGDVVLGSTSNSSTTETRIEKTTTGDPAFGAVAPIDTGSLAIRGESYVGVLGVGDFVGVQGETSDTGMGVRAVGGLAGIGLVADAWDNGIRAFSNDENPSDFEEESHRTAVIGVAGGAGRLRPNTDETGVYGFADASLISTGIWGDSVQGYGVYGSGDVGVGAAGFIGVEAIPAGAGSMGVFAGAGSGETGIYAFAGTGQAPAPAQNTALEARAGSTSQLALNVVGKTRFSRSGRTTVAAGQRSKTVTMAGVNTSSYIIATPQTNRTGVFVQSVVPATGSFKINLNKTVSGSTIIGYLVIN